MASGASLALILSAAVGSRSAEQQKLEEAFGFTVLKEGSRLGWLVNMQPVRILPFISAR